MCISNITFAHWRERALEGMDSELADGDISNSRAGASAKHLAQTERPVTRLELEKAYSAQHRSG